MIYDKSQDQCVEHFRQDDSAEVIEKVDTAAHQKKESVLHNAVYNIRDRNQKQRRLDIIIIENAIKVAAEIADPQIDQRIESDNSVEKNIREQSAEKADEKSFLLTPHKTESRGENDEQVGNRVPVCNSRKHRALQKKTEKY